MIKLCKYHYNKPANKSCEACGEGLCKYCGVRVNDKAYCKDCAPYYKPKHYKF